MRLLISIPLAMLGSMAGSALRSALQAAEERLQTEPDAPRAEMNLNVSGSALAGVAGGVVGLLFGARTAFWIGVALGAAGIERFDFRLLKLAGVDVQALVERARTMAAQAQGGASDATPAAEFTVESGEASQASEASSAEIA